MQESGATLSARELIERITPIYPLDMNWFTNQLGLEYPVFIYWKPFLIPEINATTKQTGSHVSIYINQNHPYTRQLFGFAHECGHLYLKHRSNPDILENGEDPGLHREADEFATEVLMPRLWTTYLACRSKTPLSLIRLLTRRHSVSVEAASRRILELQLYSGVITLVSRRQIIFNYTSDDHRVNKPALTSLVLRETDLLPRGCYTERRTGLQRTSPYHLYAYRFPSGDILAACVLEPDRRCQYGNMVQDMVLRSSYLKQPASTSQNPL